MDHRIRKAMNQGGGQLLGTVEVDETSTRGRSTATKTPVFGMFQRGGQIRATVVSDARMRTIEQKIIENVAFGSEIHTDEFPSYDRMKNWYQHETVRHNLGVREGLIHTNSTESFWALFKRGYAGIYHWMGGKHSQRHVDGFMCRFNSREQDFADVFPNMVGGASDSSPLPYKAFIQ
jgi:transposase-like protein